MSDMSPENAPEPMTVTVKLGFGAVGVGVLFNKTTNIVSPVLHPLGECREIGEDIRAIMPPPEEWTRAVNVEIHNLESLAMVEKCVAMIRNKLTPQPAAPPETK